MLGLKLGELGSPGSKLPSSRMNEDGASKAQSTGMGDVFWGWPIGWKSTCEASWRGMCGFMSWRRQGMRWDARWRKQRRSDLRWPERNVSPNRSLARPVVGSVRFCIGSGHWRRSTGRSNFTNRSAIARLVAEIFFPQRPALGLDQRTYSPAVVDKIVSANAEHKSTYKAQKMLRKLAELSISVPEIMELSSMIGQELREHLEEQAAAHAAQTLEPQYAQAPSLAVVSTDGGRIMTRAEGERGVHDQAWKETKNACLMTMSSTPSEQDPHPELPTCFKDRAYVEQLVREIHSTASRGRRIPGKSRRFPRKPWPPRHPLASRRPCNR